MPRQIARPAQHLRRSHRGVPLWRRQHLGGHQPGPTFGDGARLVERYRLDLVGGFQIDPTLDKNAAPRGRRQAAHHRDGRGDDQGTRAGNHEQDQGLVQRLRPCHIHQPGHEHCHCHGQRKHHGRVDGGKLVHKLLRGRAASLGLLDRMDDAGQRGVAGRGRDPHFQGAGVVDGAGKQGVAHGLVHGHALARHRGLVHRTRARDDHAIERHARARPDAHHGVQRHAGRRGLLPGAVGLAHLGRVGGQVEQALDGVARPVHRTRLDQLGQGIQRHHHGGLGPLADDKRPGHGHGHQRIDVEPPPPERSNALAVGGKTGQPDGGSGQRHARHLKLPRLWRPKSQQLGGHGQPQRQAQAPQPPGARLVAVRLRALACNALCQGLRIKPCPPDGRQDLRHGRGQRIDGQRAGSQLKMQTAQARNTRQRVANLAFLGRAVHGCDAKNSPMAGTRRGAFSALPGGRCRGRSGRRARTMAAGIRRSGRCVGRWAHGCFPCLPLLETLMPLQSQARPRRTIAAPPPLRRTP